jgi:cytochrome P450
MTATDVQTPLDQVDIYDPDLLECPHAFYRRLRDEAPVLKDAASGIYQVSSYGLATQALMDHKTFSSVISHALHGKSVASEKVRAVMAEGYERPQTLQTADQPIHTRSRKLVDKAFTMKRVNEMTTEIAVIVDQLIDGFAGRGSVEFVTEFAQPLPLLIIAKQLGVPLEDLPKFRTWSDAFAAQFSHTAGEDGEVEAARHVVAFQHYFADMIEQKRREPTDDMISVIANATLSEEGDNSLLEIPEALQIVQQVLVAGNETTASSLAEGMKLFIEHPGTIDRLRDDPEALAKAIEEVIRLHSPVQTMWRIARHDTELGGVAIPKDSLVLIRFGAANLDDAMFPDGEAFDISRPNVRRHIAFGYGIHVCIGAALARKEMAIAFERLFKRVKGWKLAPGADLSHHSSVLLRGLKRLDLEFTPEA